MSDRFIKCWFVFVALFSIAALAGFIVLGVKLIEALST